MAKKLKEVEYQTNSLSGMSADIAQVEYYLRTPVDSSKLVMLNSEESGLVAEFANVMTNGGLEDLIGAWRQARCVITARQRRNETALRHIGMNDKEIASEALENLVQEHMQGRLTGVAVNGERYYTSTPYPWLRRIIERSTLAILNPDMPGKIRTIRTRFREFNDDIRLGIDGIVVLNPETNVDGIKYSWGQQSAKLSFVPQPPIWLGLLNNGIGPLLGRQETWAPIGTVLVKDREEGGRLLATILTIDPHGFADGLEEICGVMRQGDHRVTAGTPLEPEHFFRVIQSASGTIAQVIDGNLSTRRRHKDLPLAPNNKTRYLMVVNGDELDLDPKEWQLIRNSFMGPLMEGVRKQSLRSQSRRRR